MARRQIVVIESHIIGLEHCKLDVRQANPIAQYVDDSNDHCILLGAGERHDLWPQDSQAGLQDCIFGTRGCAA